MTGVDGAPPSTGTAGDVVYPYTNQEGALLYEVVRKQRKNFSQRRVDSSGKRHSDMDGVERVPYRLPELIAAAEKGSAVFVVEGEKDVDRLIDEGLCATTSPQGAPFPWPSDWPNRYFRGLSTVYVIADNDNVGRDAAKKRAKALADVVPDVRLVNRLPGVAEKGDVSDYLDAGRTAEDLCRVADGGVQVTLAASRSEDNVPEPARGAAVELVEFRHDATLFFTDDDVAWTGLPFESHVEYHQIGSKRHEGWLRRRYWEKTGRSVPANALAEALATWEALAIGEGSNRLVNVRVGQSGCQTIIDLGQPAWNAVVVDAVGWNVVDDQPVPFRRRRGATSLPTPEQGGTIGELKSFINVDDEGFALVLGFLAQALQPTGPYPILVFYGEHGSAKTTTTRVLRSLIDPSTAATRSAPKDERDLAIAANNGWLLAFDNLSHVPPWLSDALCRLSTGGGFATRALYSNDEETIFNASRPIILNGIEEIAQRPDPDLRK